MKDTIQKLAKSARLHLSSEEIEEFAPQLKEILDFFNQIKDIPTEKEEIAIQPIAQMNVWREDTPGKTLSQQDIFKNTKSREKNFFKGPRTK